MYLQTADASRNLVANGSEADASRDLESGDRRSSNGTAHLEALAAWGCSSSRARQLDEGSVAGMALLESLSAAEEAGEDCRAKTVVEWRRRVGGLMQQRERPLSLGDPSTNDDASSENSRCRNNHEASFSDGANNNATLQLRRQVALRRGSIRDLGLAHLPGHGDGLGGLRRATIGEESSGESDGSRRRIGSSNSGRSSSTSVDSGSLNRPRRAGRSPPGSESSRSRSARFSRLLSQSSESSPSESDCEYVKMTGLRDSGGGSNGGGGSGGSGAGAGLSIVAQRKEAGQGLGPMSEAAEARSRAFTTVAMSLAERVAKRRGSFARDLPHLDLESLGGTGLDEKTSGSRGSLGGGGSHQALQPARAVDDASKCFATGEATLLASGKKKQPKKPTKLLSNRKQFASTRWFGGSPNAATPSSGDGKTDSAGDGRSEAVSSALETSPLALTPLLDVRNDDEDNPFLRGSFDDEVPEEAPPPESSAAETLDEQPVLSAESEESTVAFISSEVSLMEPSLQMLDSSTPLKETPPSNAGSLKKLQAPGVDSSSSSDLDSDSDSDSDSDAGVETQSVAADVERAASPPARSRGGGKEEGIDRSGSRSSRSSSAGLSLVKNEKKKVQR
jgi:hypothetical protein